MDLVLTNQGLISGYDIGLNNLFNSDQSVYEVFRVIDGVALFLEDHFIRLQKSMEIKGFRFEMVFADFKYIVSELVRINHREEGNIKFVYSDIKGDACWALSFIPHHYPISSEYQLGVSTDLLFAERENPNAKVIQSNIRERANRMIKDRHLYEVLLVDRNGMITEGSRSNVFVVKNEVFYTAPDSQVLGGITRQKVLECLEELKFSVTDEAVCASEIALFDAVFLTGTSPKVLPVRSIGNHNYSTQLACVKKLIAGYDNMIREYINKQKNFEE